MKGFRLTATILLIFNSWTLAQLNYAKVGEFYEVSGNGALALLMKPKVSTVASINKSNIITSLDNGPFNIEVLKTKGIIDRYYYIHIIGHGKIKLRGWIWSKGVSNSKKITKEKAYYVEPVKTYNPDKETIQKAINVKEGVVMGQWVDNDQWIGGIYVLKKKGEKYSLQITYKDRSVSKKDVKVLELTNDIKITYTDGHSDYYFIKPNGNLEMWDNDGYFKTIKPFF